MKIKGMKRSKIIELLDADSADFLALQLKNLFIYRCCEITAIQRDYSHPYYGVSFILIGDGR